MPKLIHDNKTSLELINSELPTDSLVTRIVRVYGIVQGVGFRPTVSRHAAASGIRGTVCNKGPYVEIIAQGNAAQCDAFIELLKTKPPKRASILRIDVSELKPAQSRLDSESAAGKSSVTHKCSERVADGSDYNASTEYAADDYANNGNALADASLPTDSSLPIYKDFTIIDSAKTKGAIYISPDIAICEDCKRELYDKADRRYLHPFINCTNCGPRMTILDALPYDRERTSMKMFPMCRTCSCEYHSPNNRRFDAQPVCCNECGPKVYILDKTTGLPSAKLVGSAAINHVRMTIINGGIAAVKGIGGFHLCCDATNEAAVRLLRERKHRAAKPFAVMMRDLAAVERECLLTDNERELLTGHQKPIVLLRKRCGASLVNAACKPEAQYSQDTSAFNNDASGGAASFQDNCSSPLVVSDTAPDNPKLGVMLPYAPIQLLIFDYDDGLRMPDCLVMTSANESGAPICRDDADALNELSELADVILSNDRLIRVRADDTVTDFYKNEPYMIRRSRGFTPLPLLISSLPDSSCSVLGIGGELKNSFCLGTGQLFYPSPYVGDLGDIRTVDALRKTIRRFETLLELKPKAICCDMHPLYQSRALAYELAEEAANQADCALTDEPSDQAACTAAEEAAHPSVGKACSIPVQVFDLQHHYAHILSCMAENDYDGNVIGISFDGTGYGTDGSIWGGEILRCDWHSFERLSHISPFIQVGGDISAREGWRIAAQMIGDIYESPDDIVDKLKLCSKDECRLIRTMSERSINSVKSTSAGRLFDAVSAVLDIRKVSSFEGEASTALMYKALKYDELIHSEHSAEYDLCTMASCGCAESGVPADNGSIRVVDASGNEYHSWQYPYPLLTDDGLLNTRDLVRYIIEERLAAISSDVSRSVCTAAPDAVDNFSSKIFNNETDCDASHEFENNSAFAAARLAYIFHKILAEMTAAAVLAAAKQTGIRTAALSGGVFQNTLLLKLTEEQLTACSIKVLRHHLIPPNDGGIGLGQAVYAMKRILKEE